MSCPISWSIITKRETTKARTIFCFSPSLLCNIAMRHVRSAVESGSVAYSNITAVSHEYFGLTRIHIPLSAQKEIDRSPCLIHRPVEVDPMSADLYIRLIHPPGSADWPSITLPALLEFRQVMLDPTENRGVGQRNAPIRHH